MLADIFARIEVLKAELDALRPLKPEYGMRLWQKLRLEWNYNSNHIEGNTLTYGETYLLLVHDKTNGGHTMREFEEIKAHDLAISKVEEWSKDIERSLTEADVRDLNGILLKEPFWKEAITPDGQPTRVRILPGEYKKEPNNVRLPNGGVFQFATVEETRPKMRALMEWFMETTDLHPIAKAAKFHHDFVLIHPFGDGNGRTARLVVNYILMQAGYMPLVIKSADKNNYLMVLQLADAGDLLPLTEYLAEQERWALELGIKAAKGEDLEEEEDWKKRGEVLRREILAGAQSNDNERSRLLGMQLHAIESLFSPIVSRLDEIALSHRDFFHNAAAHIALYGLGESKTTFGQLSLGLAISKKDVLRLLKEGGYKPYVQMSYDLSGFKHGAELRRWFIVNWFFEDSSMRLEFVPKRIPSITFSYDDTWETLDHSFVLGIATWIQEGIQRARR